MRLLRPLLGLALLLVTAATALGATLPATPAALNHALTSLELVDRYQAPVVDASLARLEDEEREAEGLPPRFAIPYPVDVNPATRGTWDTLPNGDRVWRLRVSSPGAVSLNLGFTVYDLPETARLVITAADYSSGLEAYTAADNAALGELWTPVLLTDDIVVELTVAEKAVSRVLLTLGSINVGYRGFGQDLAAGDRSGSCNVDVVCPEGDDWRGEIPAVGVISTGGSTFCTGFMVNNTAQDGTPYFMTANHCGITAGNAASLVVYWNFESPNCGDQCCGSLAQHQTGSFFRSSYAASDFTLVELDELPNPAWLVTYAGWDNTSADPSAAIAIHHPNTDEKSISFEYDPTSTTSYLSNTIPGDGTHIRITDWDLGTTEPGSSGSPLFNPAHRVVGQLHGGYASCTSQTSDWYGRFSVSWTHGLSAYLDPIGSGATVLDTFDPAATGMRVTPADGLVSSGDQGGPFTPDSKVYTVENASEASIQFSVTDDASWVDVTGGGGTLAPGATAYVTVSINSGANGLPQGLQHATVLFTNVSTGDGDTQRSVDLQIGAPSLQISETFDSNPGWSTQGQWAFGTPTGGGGADHGNADPSSGFTGSYVYGYNLNGDYTNNMPEYHLTSTAFDCSNLTATQLKFKRWLNVEQPAYDHAYVRVSNDNVNWVELWQNAAEVTDNGWQSMEYDISAVADGQSTVYLRWTMGTTDSSWLFSGWNVDDVEIWGISGDVTAAGDGAAPQRSALLANVPNPFNPKTEIRYAVATAGEVRVGIFDVAGRRVATLVAGHQEAGRHSVTWNGTDDSGRALSSGVYFARLETAGGSVDTSKLTLLK
ncbi:trypsin-like peptidase domain-containing protein [bacterium]|nr:trypsin-like peptidase domain-containing protein [bacterium]